MVRWKGTTQHPGRFQEEWLRDRESFALGFRSIIDDYMESGSNAEATE
jgi:hypothetical protein